MSKLDEMFTCSELGQGFKPIKKGKKMSMKEHITPEVGDIWETDLHICYIVRVTDNIVEFIVSDKPYYDGIKYKIASCSNNFFKALWQFKCKSKMSLDDLFKTENEE